MKAAIHQPQYLPWTGYLDKMDRADVFVLLDDVQYKKNEWQNRNRIRNAEGWQWITVPVLYEFGQKLNDVSINNKDNWREKHLKSIETNYSHAAHFDEYMPFFRKQYSYEWEKLVDINVRFIEFLADALGITTEIVRSSSLGIGTEKTQRLIDICKAVGADEYLSGAGGCDYLEEEKFADAGIGLEYQKYAAKPYEQVYNGFYPDLSAVDLLFCCGKKSINIIREGRGE
jgi:hypothetical protein